MANKCECPGTGKLYFDSMYDEETELPFVNHDPYECQCINDLRLYWRDGKLIVLCSNCCLSTDVKS